MQQLNITRRSLIASIAGLLFFSCPALSASLTSTVDRNQLSINETLTLSVAYDQQVDASQLDLNTLGKDFDILGVSPQSSNSISIVNGTATRQASTVWTITIAPKRPGRLIIPAFSIEQDSTSAITIEVKSGPVQATDQPLAVRVSADRSSIFPSQQLLVEIEISAQSDIRDLNGPQLIINNADVEVLGQQSLQRIDNGVARQVVVIKYAVFAKQAGELVVPVMSFTGVKGGRRSLFDSFGRTQQVIARSKQLAVKVEAPPTTNATPWFPAESVSISSEWSGDINDVKVGEPITRIIKVIASGQRASAIPPLNTHGNPKTYKTYKDQPQLDDQTSADGITGMRIEAEAIVASIDQQIMLPEVSISWWNVATRQWQQAVLPAEVLNVSGSANTPEITAVEQARVPAAQAGTVPHGNYFNNSLGWKLVTGLLLTIIALQLWLIQRMRTPISKHAAVDDAAVSESQAWSQLQRSLKQADAASIRVGLLKWAQVAFPDSKPVSLQSLLDNHEDPLLKTELQNLDKHLYRDQAILDVDKLADAIRKFRRQAVSSTRRSSHTPAALPPLYRNKSE